ncbi:carbonate dehydratase [Immundisolibacter sp.]|uniref:carbonate dehydratase n=1 Tax=Immundisolibacter sp. TaxID=1934948 RepID=UPI00356A297E
MSDLNNLLVNNRAWAERVKASDPGFFSKLTGQQRPQYLWIGCSDSRVPANQIVGLLPGDIFVHRNVGNLVHQTDLNCLAVLQYAVEVLKVRHVIVCGHYGCGAVQAALDGRPLGLIDNWLRNIETVHRACSHIDALPADQRLDALCEHNVRAQVQSVCDSTVMRAAWAGGQDVTVHGWIYGIADGLVKDLGVSRAGLAEPVAAGAT